MMNILKNVSLFNFGNLKQTISNSNLDISEPLKRNMQDFENGNIDKAFLFLEQFAKDNDANKKIRYKIQIQKLIFYINLNNLDNAKKILDNLKNHYSDMFDSSFDENYLTLQSCCSNKDEFNKTKNKLLSEDNTKHSELYFDFIYAYNNKNYDEAMKFYNSLGEKEKSKLFELDLNWIFLQRNSNSFEIVDKIQTILSELLEGDLIDKLNYMQKFMLYSIYFMFIEYLGYTTALLNKDDNYFNHIYNFKTILEKLLSENIIKHFNEQYKYYFKLLYASLLLDLKEFDNFKVFYEQNIEDLLDLFYIRYIDLTNQELDIAMIEEKILTQKYPNLLTFYVSYFSNFQGAYDFFSKNLNLIKDNKIWLYHYIKGCVNFNKDIDKNLQTTIVQNKDKCCLSYFTYLITLKNISEDNIKKLYAYYKQNEYSLTQSIIKDVLYFMQKNKSIYYLKLLDCSKISHNMVIYLLDLCRTDSGLKNKELENFIKELNQVKYFKEILTIYDQRKDYKKVINFIKINWNSLGEKVKKEIIVYCMCCFVVDAKYRDSDFLNTLQSYYKLNIDCFTCLDDLKIFLYVNKIKNELDEDILYNACKKLLNIDEKEINIDLYNLLHNTISIKNLNSIKNEKNKIFYKDNFGLIDNNYYKYINKNLYFRINIAQGIENERMKYDKSYHQDILIMDLFMALFMKKFRHMEEVNYKPIVIDEKNPFKSLCEAVKPITEKNERDKNNALKLYSENTIHLNELFNMPIFNQLELIPMLLENKEVIFHTCKFLESPNNKLLTFSSIMFLEYLHKLENVLKRQDVYVPQSVFEYILDIKANLEQEKDVNNINYSEDLASLSIKTNKDKLEQIQKIIDLIPNEKIIDDTLDDDSPEVEKTIFDDDIKLYVFGQKNNYQIISENSFFDLRIINYTTNSSNSLILLLQEKDFFDIVFDLDMKNYYYPNSIRFVTNSINYILSSINISECSDKLQDNFMAVISKYGYIEQLELFYNTNYKVLYPRAVLPKNTLLKRNLEFILEKRQ